MCVCIDIAKDNALLWTERLLNILTYSSLTITCIVDGTG